MTAVLEFATMAWRIELELQGTGAGYTPKLRELEDSVDAAHCAFLAGTVERSTVSLAIRQLELEWRTVIARAQRTRQGASR